ncbi:MAG: galactose oxidase [Chloroflexi bacterium]|nr:galactose oxidase [Chloroflexota bacterium]
MAVGAVAAVITVAGVAALVYEPWRRAGAPGAGWTRRAPMPAPRGEVAVAGMARAIFVIGGLTGAGASTARVDALDLSSGVWLPAPPLPVPLNHAAAAAVGERVYVAGGSEQFGRPPRREAYALDLSGGFGSWDERRWERIAPPPSGRWAAGMAAAGGRLYLVGGVTGSAESSIPTLLYDPLTDRWEQRAPLPAPREHVGVAASGNVVYAAGGRWENRNLAAVESYDPVTDRWQALPPLAVARSGLGVAAVEAGGRRFLVAAGGEDPGFPGRVFAETEVFDVAARAWRTVAPLPTPRHGLGAAGRGANAYFIAGATLPGARSVLGWSGANEIYRVDASPA